MREGERIDRENGTWRELGLGFAGVLYACVCGRRYLVCAEVHNVLLGALGDLYDLAVRSADSALSALDGGIERHEVQLRLGGIERGRNAREQMMDARKL